MKALNFANQPVRRTPLGAFRTGLTVLAAGMALTFACNNADKPALSNQKSAPVVSVDSLTVSGFTEAVLNGRIDVNAKDKDGCTALMMAASNGDTKIVSLLLEKGADPNKRGNLKLLNLKYPTPLMVAVRGGNAEIAALLLKHGADIEAVAEEIIGIDAIGLEETSWEDITPLMRAIIEGQNEVAILLIRNKANVNAMDFIDRTPLMYAAREGQPGIVSLLLEKGADPNAKDQVGRTALTYAIKNGNTETAALLRAKMAK